MIRPHPQDIKAMAVHHSKTKQQQLLLLLLVSTLFILRTSSQPISLPNCPTKCGNVPIPFPFGTTEACSLNSMFLIDCNQITSSPFLPPNNMTVLDISLNPAELRVEWPVASNCLSETNELTNETSSQGFNLTTPYYLSSSRNKFTIVGCNTVGLLAGSDSEGSSLTTAACFAMCDPILKISNGSCSGTACSATSIPKGLTRSIYYYFSSFLNQSEGIDNYNPCGRAFLVENGGYNFYITNLTKFEKTKFPVVLAWTVGNQTCQEAQKMNSSYACKANHSECYNSTEGPGYFCNCTDGFRGNPYLHEGCEDIDECKESIDDCVEGAKCSNTLGSYNCLCQEGYEGDGKNDRTKDAGCSPKSSTKSKRDIILIIALIVSLSILALLVGSLYVNKKRKYIKLKERFFQQNGGFMLLQHISSHRGSTEMAKVFTVEELKEATNNFDEGKILGQGGQGTVYKGLLQDNRTVAIKKSKISDPNQIEQFINEVIVLSQINHRNVVKILGCCLETEVPLLVYEFIPNGTIYEHLHDQTNSLKLLWKTRLKIAAETAGALAYLHSAAASTPIIHRDVKTTNILLDHNLTAKVSDFGASKVVPMDKTQLTTLVQGTWGYLDPEYFHTSLLTEKSDVYSFGVVLAELLTGKKALSFERPEVDRNLAVYFVSSMKEGRLLHIVDTYIIDDASVEKLMEVGNIAKRCLRVNGEDRPTMKEVAMELEGIIVMEQHRWGSINVPLEETENLLKAESSVFNVEGGIDGSGVSSSTFDSIKKLQVSYYGGR